MKSKKAQNEIVGFILIVVIVVVVGLFLLVFYINQEPLEYKSKTVENFLQASMLYTTDCVLSIEPINLRSLMKKCYDGLSCLDERETCKVLNETLVKIVEESWVVGEDRPENAYFIDIYYEESSFLAKENQKDFLGPEKQGFSRERKTSEKEEIIDTEKFTRDLLHISEGNCTGSKKGAEYFLDHAPGTIVIEMEICYT